jgi:hypothetical protein
MDPVVVTLPHRQGKAEATRRIKAGIEALRARYTAQLKIAEENWEGDRMRFRAAVLGQTITGAIDVSDDEVRTEVVLISSSRRRRSSNVRGSLSWEVPKSAI